MTKHYDVHNLNVLQSITDMLSKTELIEDDI